MSKAIRDNLIITVMAIAVAAMVGLALKKSQDSNRIKVERAITFTGNTALDRGYACGAAQRNIDECRAELWTYGTAPVKVYRAIR